MNHSVIIRNETAADYATVEEITRSAFWNLYVPGCEEHYLVHIMRSHPDFIPELDLVLEVDKKIIGCIMYTKSQLIDEAGHTKEILTFGPLCFLPEYQRKGYSKKLLEASFQKAISMGYDTIVIFGNPGNYVSRGFKSCKKFNICVENGTFPTPMLVKELKPDVLDGRKWIYRQSPVFEYNPQEAQRFDDNLEKWEKKHLPCQEEFYILSNSVLQ